jgi:D-alanyl-D-alanine carboxypeptidase/D-alanyl-D-alanine-endopeptidase (penicillin-binding protein 4)
MVMDAYFRLLQEESRSAFLQRFSGARLVEGSGLSRQNFLSAHHVLHLLSEIQSGPHFSFYLACLPQPGEVGTLDTRMQELSEQVALKTGSLGGISQLAGFVRRHSQEPWTPFVFLYENRQQRVRLLRRSQDRIVRALLQ